MYELIPVTPSCYYIESPAKIGLVRCGENDVCLIDSGNDKDAGRKVRRILDTNGWTLRAIYNTHSNADHIGGNQYLQQQTNCKIYAPGIECDFTRHPLLEPSFLYGGCPPAQLRHKFLMARPSSAEELSPDVLPEGWSILPLPGHFFDMIGFRTPDDVVYLADCLCSEQTLQKYKIGFIYDVAAYLETLNMVKELDAAMFIPSHAEAAEQIAPLVQTNIDAVLEVGETILAFCSDPLCFEDILSALFTLYQLTMNFEQYALIGSTVRSYLTWLKETGRMDCFFEDNRLFWTRT